jgi:hypothetical protein
VCDRATAVHSSVFILDQTWRTEIVCRILCISITNNSLIGNMKRYKCPVHKWYNCPIHKQYNCRVQISGTQTVQLSGTQTVQLSSTQTVQLSGTQTVQLSGTQLEVSQVLLLHHDVFLLVLDICWFSVSHSDHYISINISQ